MPRLAELNPYTNVVLEPQQRLTAETDLSFLQHYHAVVMLDQPLDLQLLVNDYCHKHDPTIAFVSGSVVGVCGSLFVDLGPSFEVVDSTDEELKEVFISNVSKGPDAVVKTLERHLHGLEDGDVVTFREVRGMEELNDGECT